MAKAFEDYFSEALIDMATIGMEYADYRVEKAFVYCFRQDYFVNMDCFYQRGGKILFKNQLNDELLPGEKPIETSQGKDNLLDKVLDVALSDIVGACRMFNREIPTVIKVTYNAATSKMQTRLGYERYDLGDDLREMTKPRELFLEWMEEERRKMS